MDAPGLENDVLPRGAPSEHSVARSRLITLLTAMRPEREAGGFAHDDGTVQFYARVNALLSPDMTLLDFGAGRGRPFHVPGPGYGQVLQKFQGKVAKVIGVDVDEAIHEHPYLDERHVISAEQRVPIPSGSVDIVVADWVFEHLEHPATFVKEMERVLVPGGWICARTVNRWGYVGIGARLLPNRIHQRLVPRLIPVAKSEDVFPTFYRLNTLGDVRRWFPPATWDNRSFLTNTTPRYFGNSRLFFRAIELYQRVVPHRMRTDLFVFIRRR